MHKKVSYGGMGAALGVIFVALSSFMPTCRAALIFCASASIYCVGVLCGVKTAAAAYGASAVISAIFCLFASPVMAVAYIICFGNYPVFHLILRGKGTRAVFAKAVLYAVYFATVYCVFRYFVPVEMKFSAPVLFAAGAVCFAVYDVLLANVGKYAAKKFH